MRPWRRTSSPTLRAAFSEKATADAKSGSDMSLASPATFVPAWGLRLPESTSRHPVLSPSGGGAHSRIAPTPGIDPPASGPLPASAGGARNTEPPSRRIPCNRFRDGSLPERLKTVSLRGNDRRGRQMPGIRHLPNHPTRRSRNRAPVVDRGSVRPGIGASWRTPAFAMWRTSGPLAGETPVSSRDTSPPRGRRHGTRNRSANDPSPSCRRFHG